MANALIFLCYWLVWSKFCLTRLNSLKSEIFITCLLLCSPLKYSTNGELHSAGSCGLWLSLTRVQLHMLISKQSLWVDPCYIFFHPLLITCHLTGRAAACEVVNSVTCQWNCKTEVWWFSTKNKSWLSQWAQCEYQSKYAYVYPLLAHCLTYKQVSMKFTLCCKGGKILYNIYNRLAAYSLLSSFCYTTIASLFMNNLVQRY